MLPVTEIRFSKFGRAGYDLGVLCRTPALVSVAASLWLSAGSSLVETGGWAWRTMLITTSD